MDAGGGMEQSGSQLCQHRLQRHAYPFGNGSLSLPASPPQSGSQSGWPCSTLRAPCRSRHR